MLDLARRCCATEAYNVHIGYADLLGYDLIAAHDFCVKGLLG